MSRALEGNGVPSCLAVAWVSSRGRWRLTLKDLELLSVRGPAYTRPCVLSCLLPCAQPDPTELTFWWGRCPRNQEILTQGLEEFGQNPELCSVGDGVPWQMGLD